MKTSLKIEFLPKGQTTVGSVIIRRGNEVIFEGTLDLAKARSRRTFANRVAKKFPGIDSDDVENQLLQQLSHASNKSDGFIELDVRQVERPQLFHTPWVSGTIVYVTGIGKEGPRSKPVLYLCWKQGVRKAIDCPAFLDIPRVGKLYLSPPPHSVKRAVDGVRWSKVGRKQFLDGHTPKPGRVFQQICGAIDRHIDFPSKITKGAVATLAVFVVLTYCFPAWRAVPYISVGGTKGTGKTTLLEVLEQMIFRAIRSSNMSAACLFRMLHAEGGILLLDEAECLYGKEGEELKNILLSGYKAGSPARRLEANRDGKFIPLEFDVFGPKVMAAISELPDALMDRCIRFMMIRADKNSVKPKQRIDQEAARWISLRDDLHAMALAYGPELVKCSDRRDVVKHLSNREYELWQPLLAIAKWLESKGQKNLVSLIGKFAEYTIGEFASDSFPEPDLLLLNQLADFVNDGAANVTPKLLLDALPENETIFKRWTPKRVANVLRRYGVKTTKTKGQRNFNLVTMKQLAEIQNRWSITLEHVPQVP